MANAFCLLIQRIFWAVVRVNVGSFVARCLQLVLASLVWVSVAQAAMPPAFTIIRAEATATYTEPTGTTGTTYSNEVIATINPVELLTLNADNNLRYPANSQVAFSHLLTNVGNVRSSYTFSVDTTSCPSSHVAFNAISLYRDINSDNVPDANDQRLVLGSAHAITLESGNFTQVLLVASVPLADPGSLACARLLVKADTNSASTAQASNKDTVTITSNASVRMNKEASYSGAVQAGYSEVTYTIRAQNIGGSRAAASATATIGTEQVNVLVNGQPTALFLIRDVLPTGMQYVAGSLETATAGAVRLFRLASDPAFSYRSEPAPVNGVASGRDDAAAAEVAIGLPSGLGTNTSIALSFKAKVLANAPRVLSNVASSHFNDGSANTVSLSNANVINTQTAVLGLAKAAVLTVANSDSVGAADGTATTRFRLKVGNYGTSTLYNVRISDLLENVQGGLGAYTSATVPSIGGQYTVVSGSLAEVERQGVPAPIALATNFTGKSNATNLQSAGATIAPGGWFTLQFDVRYNLQGLADVLFNSASANASVGTDASNSINLNTQSVKGTNPDAAGDGNPSLHASLTPYSTRLPVLSLVKTMSAPQRPTGQPVGVYDMEVALRVTNVGTADAVSVRLMDNVSCVFPTGSSGAFESWSITAAPRTLNGLLLPNASYTGNLPCDAAAISSTDPVASFPQQQTELGLVDGTRGLRVGESETVRFTLRFKLKPSSIGSLVTASNKAWAGVVDSNGGGTPIILWGTSSSVSQTITDPSGVIYNAVTRAPVAGATVTLARLSCDASAAGPITAAELAATGYAYSFANGAASMVTGADGKYKFLFRVPPVNDFCTYDIRVTPPSSSGLQFPSTLIASESGVFRGCSPVGWSGSEAPPPIGETTRYFSQVRAGGTAAPLSICEVTYNHIPLDPASSTGLTLQKTASSTTVEVGDLLTYTLKVSNQSNASLVNLRLVDDLPAGFRYVPGSTRVAGVRVADPAGGVGPRLTLTLPVSNSAPFATGQSITVTYQVRVGVGTPVGDYAVNRASVSSGAAPSQISSNEAVARVRVLGGVFADEAYAFGKVYMDCNKNGLQDEQELGIPGVRLFMEDGTGVVTDLEGKWSLYGLRPVTHALRLDTSTLPAGAALALVEPRQSGQADSVFMDLKKGEWHRANFVVQNCDNAQVLQEVQKRRAAIGDQPALEGEAVRANTRLSTDGRVAPPADVRGLPSAGTIDSTGALKPITAITSPLIGLPGSAVNSDFGALKADATTSVPTGLPPQPLSGSAPAQAGNAVQTPEITPMEDTLQGLDRKLAFLNIQDQQVLTAATLHVRVKGSAGSRLLLTLNGQQIPEDRVGKRARVESQQLEAWEYIGVQFQPGTNTLKLQEVDGFGIVRGSAQVEVKAAGALARIEVDVPPTAKADERTLVPVKLRLWDANGLPVRERTALTLESIATRWNVTDVNALEPGLQVMVQDGQAELTLMPPANPGDGKVRVSAGTVQTEARVIFLPDLRPLTGIGVVEGVINIRNPGNMPLGAPRAADAFESELRGWSDGAGDTKSTARAAFYFKGAIKGDYLLTTAYDSDKKTADTMFRDIQPDQFYPIYGDSSSKTFDAQSSQRLYVRIDKNRSYLLYGDFNTASSPEVRKLSQVSRTTTGLQHVYNSEDVRVTSHYSRDSLKQIIEEIPANGTSGPFYFKNADGSDLFANSETVQVIVRDRNQPNVILSSTALTRFVDYSIEPLAKRILLTRPLASLTPDLNPQSLRINYVVDTGGPAFDVAGVDVQLRLTDRLQVGVLTELDATPASQRKLAAATALARLDDKTTLRAEVVSTQTDLKGDGQAVGLELRRDDTLLKYNLNVQVSDKGFDNPSSGVVAGHSEVRGHLEYQLSEERKLKGDFVYTRDENPSGGASQTQGASIGVQQKVSPNVVAEVGIRAGQTDTSAATGFDYSSVSVGTAATTAPSTTGTPRETIAARARVTVDVPDVAGAKVFAEAEQDVNDSERRIVAVGGNYAINDKARIYGRYELISSLGSEYALSRGVQRNVGLIGVESNYMPGGRVYSESRIADTIDGRALQSAMGVRNTFEVSEGFKLTGGLEQVSALPGATGASAGASTALTTGFDWLGTGEYKGRLRGSGALELREGSDANSGLLALGVAYKLNADWSLLSRLTLNQVENRTNGSVHWIEREQIGFAYRPVGQDVWNSLLRYEHKADVWSGVQSTTTPTINTVSDIVSAHLNYQPNRSNLLSTRVAAKYNTTTSDGVRSSYGAQLLYGRWTHDISQDWDFGLQAGLRLGDGGTQQHALGAEVGYQLNRGLWLSGGYNVLGLRDPDLAGADYIDSGFYIRLRFKFDESLFVSPASSSGPAPNGGGLRVQP